MGPPRRDQRAGGFHMGGEPIELLAHIGARGQQGDLLDEAIGCRGRQLAEQLVDLLAQALGDLRRLGGRRRPGRHRQPSISSRCAADQHRQARALPPGASTFSPSSASPDAGQQGRCAPPAPPRRPALQHARQGQKPVEPGRRRRHLPQLGDESENLVEGLAVDAQLGSLLADLGQGDGDIAAAAALGHGRAHGGSSAS